MRVAEKGNPMGRSEMDLTDVFLSKSEDERIAFRALIDREDEIFKLQLHEGDDLGSHVRADLPRFQLINARIALFTAVSNRKQDRNLKATLVIGLILFIKTGVTWADVFHTLGIGH